MKALQLNLSEFQVNGVVHIGANTGEYADYYHKLGVHKVLWIEKNRNKYTKLYENTRNFGMKQKILIENIHHASNFEGTHKTFLQVWRENASFIDLDTYDMLHVACDCDAKKLLEGCDKLLTNFRIIVTSKDRHWPSTEAFLDSNFRMIGFTDTEHLYLRRDL